jgi:hypothetical protein
MNGHDLPALQKRDERGKKVVSQEEKVDLPRLRDSSDAGYCKKPALKKEEVQGSSW